MYLFHRIEELASSRDATRHAIGSFILKEHASLQDYTIDDIARLTFTSKASVTRFAKALGYDGWRSFLHGFIREESYEEKHASDIDVNRPFAPGDSDALIAEKIGDLKAETIADTFANLDRGMLSMAVRRLEASKSVTVFGLSPHCYSAGLFCRKMTSIGMPANVVPSGEFGLTAGALGPKDCAILISYSGDNADENPMKQVPLLQENKVQLIALTSGGHNYLREQIPCTLTISSRERLYSKIATFATEESVAYLLDVLFSCYFARNYEANYERKLQGSIRLEDVRRAALKEIREQQ